MPPRRRNSSQQPAQANANGGQGAVYGPRSALTSFLREQGITGPAATPQFRPRTGQRLPSSGDATTPVTLTTTTEDDDDQVQVTTASTSNGDAQDPTAANADAGPSTGSKRSSTGKSAAAAKKKKLLKKPDEDQVAANGFSLGGSQLAPPPPSKQGRYASRPVGSFAVCAECGKKFTVSKYTASDPKGGGGVLCQPCTSESIEERATFPGAGKGAGSGSGASTPKRPKITKKKSQKGVDETLFTPVITLQQSCLAIISQYIHSVEALGDLGPKNLDKVAKIVSKHRALDDENLKLFLDVGHREIRLYDCTKLTHTALSSISTFSPHLDSLTLLQCGRLDDDVLTAWSSSSGFKELRHLTLYAPYLVRARKWKEWFEGIENEGEGGRPELETFQLRMSSRFDDAALEAFVKHNPHVVHLQLSELGKLTSSSLSLLHPLALSLDPTTSEPLLRSLDLSRLGTPQGHSLLDKDLISLLATGLGKNLERLVLDGNVLLTERSLTEGVRRYCHRLRELSLSDCEGSVEGEGVEALFTGRWPGEEEEEGEDKQDTEMQVPDGGEEAATTTTTANGANGTLDASSGDAEASTSAAAAAVTATTTTTNGNAEASSSTDIKTNDVAPEEEEEDLPLFEPGKPWRSPGLTLLNLHRHTSLTPSALSALIAHSGHSLIYLNLHSCDDLDAEALTSNLASKEKKTPKLQVLDLSFVRAVDNFVVQAVLERGSEELRVLFLHGNNRVTSDVPRKRGVHLRGLENAYYTEIPAGVPWEA
ncbi:hypothetical protein JCM10908_006317 [Rhodotorula pacifica]|uniref:UV-damaged DNA-binding protein RAD7 n=1 Tax=Rhodotorula pacifica TaxID=1495444 RepID=UPI00316D65F7